VVTWSWKLAPAAEPVSAAFLVVNATTEAVTAPDPGRPGELLFDFTPDAEAALARCAAAGMHVVRSTDPVDGWPGL
jgi:hypothetical protein